VGEAGWVPPVGPRRAAGQHLGPQRRFGPRGV